MTTSDLTKKFLIWFQNEYPDARIWRNNRGAYKIGNRFIRYGFPPGATKSGKKLKGLDFIALFPCGYNIKTVDLHITLLRDDFLTIKFYEIKSKTDRLSEGQINFMNMITKMGGECYIVHALKKNNDFDTDNCSYFLHQDFYIEKWSVK